MGHFKDGISVGMDVMSKIVPPEHENGMNPKQHRWNWAIFVSVSAVTVGLAVHILLACGYLSPLFSGFAEADDMRKLIDAQKRQSSIALEDAILTANERWCRSSGEARGLYWRSLSHMRTQFEELTGHVALIPDCKDI